jgi:hypothetical protein
MQANLGLARRFASLIPEKQSNEWVSEIDSFDGRLRF